MGFSRCNSREDRTSERTHNHARCHHKGHCNSMEAKLCSRHKPDHEKLINAAVEHDGEGPQTSSDAVHRSRRVQARGQSGCRGKCSPECGITRISFRPQLLAPPVRRLKPSSVHEIQNDHDNGARKRPGSQVGGSYLPCTENPMHTLRSNAGTITGDERPPISKNSRTTACPPASPPLKGTSRTAQSRRQHNRGRNRAKDDPNQYALVR